MVADVLDYCQPTFYRFNEDSIELVHFIKEHLTKREKLKALEFGAGCGVISLELSLDIKASFHLIEIQESFKESLEFNISRQNVPVTYEIKDILDYKSAQKKDFIYFNPPYFNQLEGRKSLDLRKELCRRWAIGSLSKWLIKARELVIENGEVFFCIRSEVIDEVYIKEASFSIEKILQKKKINYYKLRAI